MTFRKLLAATVVMAGALATVPAFASIDHSPLGTQSLGVDIATVGTQQSSVKTFLASLQPTARRGVVGGCETAVGDPNGYPAPVRQFCMSVNSLTGAEPGARPEQHGTGNATMIR